MTTDLRDLYQELIVDHSKRPRNFRRLEGANHRAVGYNPLCGDRVTLYLKLDGDVIKDIAFEGSGCAISTASASILTETLRGKTRAQAEALFHGFRELVTGNTDGPAEVDLGKLVAFSGVSEFPARVKCATLSWHTLVSALNDDRKEVSTE
ncbi:MAG TPA: SUF system NifU family Fe-S cluster assembly protein [Blastocatellia bacterium]|nr:SUF system NifU family Fe-S cluster assembly protein [Blastocatellia bacterium]